jgi:hypothetical protein
MITESGLINPEKRRQQNWIILEMRLMNHEQRIEAIQFARAFSILGDLLVEARFISVKNSGATSREEYRMINSHITPFRFLTS